jgi:multisubunit Na+/H+ antiporter MnhG subunit
VADDQAPEDEPAAVKPKGDERAERLERGLQRARRTAWVDGRWLAVLAGALVPLGILLVLIGWRGASRTPNLYDQIPYLISGAELGQTLAIVGALCYFAHWLTALLREQRAQGRAIVDAIERLEAALVASQGTAPTAPALVATARGSLAHRPDCSAVVGRSGLRSVSAAAGLARCQLCLPEG